MKLIKPEYLPPELDARTQFYLSDSAPCPYLPDRSERKIVTPLPYANANSVHNALSQFGFRRSQGLAYRPACIGCNACKSVRVLTYEFNPSKSQKRILTRNRDIVRQPFVVEPNRERYHLFRSYVNTRHQGGGMSEMRYKDFANMCLTGAVKSVMFEYRLGNDPAAPLIGVSITDILRDGFSLVYSFFDPNFNRRSLGNFLILDQILYAKKLGIPHVYLGYWVQGSGKMDYKNRFLPHEVLQGSSWQRVDTLQ